MPIDNEQEPVKPPRRQAEFFINEEIVQEILENPFVREGEEFYSFKTKEEFNLVFPFQNGVFLKKGKNLEAGYINKIPIIRKCKNYKKAYVTTLNNNQEYDQKEYIVDDAGHLFSRNILFQDCLAFNKDTVNYITGIRKEQVKDIGIEIETEGVNLPEARGSLYWTAKHDGSLRGESKEYILKNPLSFEESVEALKNLHEEFVKEESELNFSFRTSVHIHINVLDLTRKQLNSFLYLSFLFEEPLVQFCGPTRIGNRFCLRCKDAEAQINKLKELIETPKQIILVEMQNFKYSAINLVPITTQGSVEFRSMQGTVDIEVLSSWMKALLRIREFAKANSIKEIAKAIKENPKAVLIDVLGEELFPLFNYKGIEEDVKDQYYRLIEIPHIKEGQ